MVILISESVCGILHDSVAGYFCHRRRRPVLCNRIYPDPNS